jgi:hypothetical protein
MTWVGMPSYLIVLVIVHPLDNVDFPRLESKDKCEVEHCKERLTVGHTPFPSVQNAGHTPDVF